VTGAEQAAGALGQKGGTAAAVQADVADPASVEAMVRFATETYGGLDVAVNNAGIGGAQAPTGEYPLDSWQKVIDVNLTGVFYCLRYQIPAPLARGGGAIVNMASILGSAGFPNSPAYVAAKHDVVGLSKAAALEYATQGIRVTAVGPGFISTPRLSGSLASDEASFVTGSYHLVDGGYTAR
jgi:NAD(P)-dependent dehydrogenase (short-subunit alcohol dehydrogenase family)